MIDDTLASSTVRRRVLEWRFQLLDAALVEVPDVDLDLDRQNLVIEWDGTRGSSWALRGVVASPEVAALFTANAGLRIRAWVTIDGDGPHPYGTFMLGQDTEQCWSGKHAYNFVDLAQMANRSVAETVGLTVGTGIEDALRFLAALCPPLANIKVEPSGRVLGEPVNLAPTANLQQAFNQLAVTYGYFGLGTDPMGRAECRVAYDPADAVAVVDYDNGASVFTKTETETRDWLSSRDEWIVEVNAGQPYRRIGRYKLPVTHPAGEAVRGFPTPEYLTSQAPGSVADADVTARSVALSSPQAWRTRRWSGWVEAGHTGFVTVRRAGLNWLDQRWSIRVAEGRMTHEVGRRVTP